MHRALFPRAVPQTDSIAQPEDNAGADRPGNDVAERRIAAGDRREKTAEKKSGAEPDTGVEHGGYQIETEELRDRHPHAAGERRRHGVDAREGIWRQREARAPSYRRSRPTA